MPEDPLVQDSLNPRGAHEIGGRAPYRARPPVLWIPRAPPDRLLSPIYVHIPQNIQEHNRSGVPPPQASVATKNLSGARSGTLPEGEPITGGHLHHPGALDDEEGVLHPRG